jgi:hypothetical protein
MPFSISLWLNEELRAVARRRILLPNPKIAVRLEMGKVLILKGFEEGVKTVRNRHSCSAGQSPLRCWRTEGSSIAPFSVDDSERLPDKSQFR